MGGSSGILVGQICAKLNNSLKGERGRCMQSFVDNPMRQTPRASSLPVTAARGKADATPWLTLTERRKRWLFALYLLFVAACSIWNGTIEARRNDPWAIGDWLINYDGGFIRRGLTGALVMILHRATRIPLAWAVFSIQASVFVLFLVCVYKLSKGIRWSYLMAAVLLSPATLAFTTLDAISGLRKEILLFAALGLTIYALVCGRLKDWQLSAMLGVFLVGVVLAHEGLLVVAPYFFAAVVIETMSLRRAIRICIIPFALAGIALVAVMLHHGNRAAAEAICSSVGGQMAKPGVYLANGGICAGAISALSLNVSEEHAGMMGWIFLRHLPRLYSLLVIPSFAPLLLLMSRFYRRDRLRYEVVAVLTCALVSVPGMAVLCYVGSDWGRWIHLQTVSLMLLAIMIDRKAGAARSEHAKWRTKRFQVIATVVLFFYATAWTLPGFGNWGASPGYLAFFWPTYRDGLHQLRLDVVARIRKVG